MRRLLAPALLALLLPGCFGSDDEGTPPTVTTTATPPASPEPTTATPPAAAPPTTTPAAPGNETPPPGPAHVANATYGYPATPSAAPHEEAFTVPAGHAQLVMNVTYRPSTTAGPLGAGVANEAKVALVDPSGAEAAFCLRNAQVTEPETCSEASASAPAGEWKLVFTGGGTVIAQVEVTAA